MHVIRSSWMMTYGCWIRWLTLTLFLTSLLSIFTWQTEVTSPGDSEDRTPGRLQAVWPPPKPKDEEEKVGLRYTEAGRVCFNKQGIETYFSFSVSSYILNLPAETWWKEKNRDLLFLCSFRQNAGRIGKPKHLPSFYFQSVSMQNQFHW